MVWPTITPLPTAPRRGDAPATFSSNANAWVAALGTFTTEVNASGAYIDQAVLDADADRVAAEAAKVDAENAEAAAVAAANYKGPWSSLSGPLAIPASVAHNGTVWMLVSSIGNVAASEPTPVNSDWIALTVPIETGSNALISEFELEGDSANVGDLVGLYSNGKVRVVKNHPGETTFASVTATFVNSIALSTTKGINVYRDESDGNKVKARLVDIAGRKITTNGSAITLASTSATYIHADILDANNIVVVYQDTSDSSQGKILVVNINGNTITAGTPVVFNAAVTTYCKVAALSATKVVIAYRDEGNSNYGVANTATISGLVPTPGTEVNFKTAAVLYVDVCKLTSTKAVVSYLGTSSYPEAVTLTINPGIVVGTNFTLKSAATTTTTISRLTDTTCVAAYESGSLLYARHLTDSSGTLTAGTEITIQANPSQDTPRNALESCQLTATRVLVTGRNATVSNQGYYWVIDNTSGTTLSNSSSAAFNSGTTAHTFPSKVLDNRALVGYQDNSLSNYGVGYVIDLSTEILKSIAGIVKEAGVEGNTIDVVTQGEVDFLSGLTPGSYYYSSATGALSATVGDYEVGVAKSATNLLMLESIELVNKAWLAKIEELFAAKKTPNFVEACQYNVWNTRTVATSSGNFTVPAGVYYLGIATIGKGGDSSTSTFFSGAGGGVALKVKKVSPGQVIQYTISGGIASVDGMIANPGDNGSTATGNGGTASGGDYNYAGGIGQASRYSGGGGAGGAAGGYGSGGGASGGGGGGGFRRLMWNESLGDGTGANVASGANEYYGGGGGGAGGNGSRGTTYGRSGAGGGLGVSAPSGGTISSLGEITSLGGPHLPYPNLLAKQLGFIVKSDFTGYDATMLGDIPPDNAGQDARYLSTRITQAFGGAPWGCGGSGNTGEASGGQPGGFGGGGGTTHNNSSGASGSGGFGGGGGGASYSSSSAGSGGFGAGGGGGQAAGQAGTGGYGGGGGCGPSDKAGGAAVVVFIY